MRYTRKTAPLWMRVLYPAFIVWDVQIVVSGIRLALNPSNHIAWLAALCACVGIALALAAVYGSIHVFCTFPYYPRLSLRRPWIR